MFNASPTRSVDPLAGQDSGASAQMGPRYSTNPSHWREPSMPLFTSTHFDLARGISRQMDSNIKRGELGVYFKDLRVTGTRYRRFQNNNRLVR